MHLMMCFEILLVFVKKELILLRFLSMPFNNAVNCWNCVASMIDEWKCMKHAWNDRPTDGGKTKYCQKTCLTACVHHKSRMDCPGIEILSLRWHGSDELSEP
jgi:hypothetical protein